MIGAVIALAAVAAIFYMVYKMFFKSYDHVLDQRMPIVRSKGWLGVANDMNQANHFAPHCVWSRELGKVYGYTILGCPTIAICDPQLFEDAVKHPALFNRPTLMYGSLRMFLGQYSLVTLNGPQWRSTRKLCGKAFATFNLKGFVKIYNDASYTCLEMMRKVPSWKAVDVGDFTVRLAMEVVLKSMFNNDHIDVQRHPELPLPQALKSVVHEYTQFCFHPLHNLNLAACYRFYKSKQYLKKLVTDILMDHVRRKEAGIKSETPDMVDLMLDAVDEDTGKGMCLEELYSQCITFFFAGHETTTHSLSWAIHEISCNPEVERKVIEEADLILGAEEARSEQDGREDLDWNTLQQKLPYISAVVKETLRLHPPAALVLREASEDLELGGYTIRKGTHVNFQIHALQTNENVWKDAHTFNPDRFLNPDDDTHSHAFFAFSMRERNCIGMLFALLEMRAVIALLYRNVIFRPDRIYMPTITAKVAQSPSAINCFIHPRDGKFCQMYPHIYRPNMNATTTATAPAADADAAPTSITA